MKKVHFIGIGGIGMSGLAQIALDRGCMVSGSDAKISPRTDRLEREGARIREGHSADAISSDMTVVYSTAVSDDNVELVAAKEARCSLLHRSEYLDQLMEGSRPLLVAGTHGKTTVSSLLAWVVLQADADPSFAVGGILPGLETNGRGGRSDLFVAEADESDGSFVRYASHGAIITNVEAEHLDHYGSVEAMEKAYHIFIDKIANPHLFLWWGDDPWLKEQSLPGMSYGFNDHSVLRGSNLIQDGFVLSFDATLEGALCHGIEVPLTGFHNALNALAVFGFALQLGLPEEKIKKGLATFPGVGRRTEQKGDVSGITVIDDYAHHPTEIRATLAGLRSAVGKRSLVAICQPHRYTRLRDCFEQFDGAFSAADHVIVTDVHAAGEEPIEGITGKSLAASLDVPYVPRSELVSHLVSQAERGDVLTLMGAGDITQVSRQVVEELHARSPSL